MPSLERFRSDIPATNLEKSLSAVQGEKLPIDLERVVGSANLQAINVISKIKAFLSMIIYGDKKDWNLFWQNYNKKLEEISHIEKKQFYPECKGSENDKFRSVLGYTPNNEEEASVFKEDKTLSEYKKCTIKFTEEEMKQIEPFLNEISSDAPKDSNVLVDLVKFLSNGVSKEVKDIIEAKLNKIPEYQALKKIKEQKALRLKRYNYLKTIALITFMATATLGIGYMIYSYGNASELSSKIINANETVIEIGKRFLNETIINKIPNPISQPPSTIYIPMDTQPWLDVSSPIGVQKTILKLGDLAFGPGIEMTKNKIANLIQWL